MYYYVLHTGKLSEQGEKTIFALNSVKLTQLICKKEEQLKKIGEKKDEALVFSWMRRRRLRRKGETFRICLDFEGVGWYWNQFKSIHENWALHFRALSLSAKTRQLSSRDLAKREHTKLNVWMEEWEVLYKRTYRWSTRINQAHLRIINNGRPGAVACVYLDGRNYEHREVWTGIFINSQGVCI